MSKALASKVLQSTDNDLIDVVLELGGNLIESKQSSMAALKESFDRKVSSIEKRVNEAGGAVLDKAWINQTLRLSVPVAGLKGLAQLEEVGLLDVPRPIHGE